MIYVVRPLTPEAKARIKGVTRVGSNFSARWSDTEELLDRELRMVGARFEFVIMVDCTESDLRLDGTLRANARPMTPDAAVAFNSVKLGDMLFACGRFNYWQDNVRAIALGLESLRRVDRYGITQAAEQYRGWQALPPGATPMPATMTADEAARFMAEHADNGYAPSGLLVNADLVRSAFRDASKRLHPDAGGDPALFVRLGEARDLLLG